MRREFLRGLVFLCVCTVAWPGYVCAQVGSLGNPDGGAVPLATQTSWWPTLARLIGSLTFVLLLVWAILWLARRTLKGRWTGAGASGVRVVERVYLAPRKSIEVVSVGQRLLVLGVTDAHISLLTELSPSDLATSGQRDAVGEKAAAASRSRAWWSLSRPRVSDGLSSLGVSAHLASENSRGQA